MNANQINVIDQFGAFPNNYRTVSGYLFSRNDLYSITIFISIEHGLDIHTPNTRMYSIIDWD